MSWHAQCPGSAHAPDATEDEMQSWEQNLQFCMVGMHGKLEESSMTGSTGQRTAGVEVLHTTQQVSHEALDDRRRQRSERGMQQGVHVRCAELLHQD